eukprot:6178391-Pleurochrysis_carterae.AAC.1
MTRPIYVRRRDAVATDESAANSRADAQITPPSSASDAQTVRRVKHKMSHNNGKLRLSPRQFW